MECTYNGSNCFFIEQDGNCYCFSYKSCVAAIVNGEYVEYSGDKYYSATSNRHKAKFRAFYGINKSKTKKEN